MSRLHVKLWAAVLLAPLIATAAVLACTESTPEAGEPSPSAPTSEAMPQPTGTLLPTPGPTLVTPPPSTPVPTSVPIPTTRDDTVQIVYTPVSAPSCLLPPSDMVGWWPLDEGGGSIAEDIVSGMDGIIQFNSAITGFIPGKVGGGYYYQDTNNNIDEVIIPHDPKLNFGTGSFTIDAWVAFPGFKGKTTSSVGPPGGSDPAGLQGAVIFSKDRYGFRVDWLMHLSLDLFFGTPPSADFSTAIPVSSLADGDWTHVAVSVDRSDTATSATIYVNGLPVPTNPSQQPVVTPPNSSINTSSDARLGWVGEEFAHMYLDEVEVFNRALTDAEILTIFAAGPNGKCKPRKQFDLRVEKNVDVSLAYLNEPVTYTVTVANIGTDPLTGLEVTDVLPTGLTYTGHSPLGAYDEQTGVWTVGALGPGTQTTLTIFATVDGTYQGNLTNTATATAIDQVDGFPYNNSDSATFTANAFERPDLAVEKTVDTTFANEGGTVLYTVTVTHDANAGFTGVVLNDLLPPGLIYQQHSGDGNYDPTPPGVWNVGTVGTNQIAQLLILAEVAPGTMGDTITNTAMLDHADQLDRDASNNTATVDFLVGPCPVPAQTPLTAGLPDGFSTANGAEPSSPSPALAGFLSGLSGGTQDFDGQSGDRVFGHTFANLPPKLAAATLEIRLRGIIGQTDNDMIHLSVDGGQSFVWSGSIAQLAGGSCIQGQDQIFYLILAKLPQGAGTVDILSDVNSGNSLDVYIQDDTALDYIKLVVANCPVDIEVVKTVSDSSPAEGETITYQIQVSNLSENPATGVEISDLLPPGVSLVNAFVNNGTLSGAGDIFIVDPLPPFTNTSVFMEVTVNSGTCGTTLTNTATLAALDQFDADTANNSDSVSATVEPCVLPPCPAGLAGIAPGPPGSVGLVILYDIDPITGAASNPRSTGVGHYIGVDFGPDGKLYAVTTFDSTGSDNNALYEINPITGSATRIGTDPNGLNIGPISEGDLAFGPTGVLYAVAANQNGQPALFTVNLATGIGTIVGAIPGLNVDISSIAFDPSGRLFAINNTISAGTSTFLSGRLFAINNTISAGTSTFLLELDPADGQILSTVTLGTNLGGLSGMDFDNHSGTFYVVDGGSSGNDQLYTLDVGSGILTPVSSPTGVAGGFSGLAVKSCITASVDIGLTKGVSNSSPAEGDVITYVIAVGHDPNKNPATGIVITDILPTGVTYVDHQVGYGTYDEVNDVWHVGSLPMSPVSLPQFSVLTIDVTVDLGTCGTTLTNVAAITAVDQEDINPANNSASVDVTVQPCDTLPPCDPQSATIFTAGVPDGFSLANGAELSSPGPALAAFLSGLSGGTQDFDGINPERVFGHTFDGLPPDIMGASIEMRLRGIVGQADFFAFTNNDTINLYMDGPQSFAWSGNIRDFAGGFWNSTDDQVLTFDLAALPTSGGPVDMLPLINSSNSLDIYIQDDTADSPIKMIDTLPDGMTFTGWSEPNNTNDWTCTNTGQLVECIYNGSTIQPGGFLSTLVIEVMLGLGEDFTGGTDNVENCGTVDHNDDINSSNDQGCVTVLVTS